MRNVGVGIFVEQYSHIAYKRTTYLVGMRSDHRELEDDILPRKAAVHRRERVQLVLQRCRIFRIQEPVASRVSKTQRT